MSTENEVKQTQPELIWSGRCYSRTVIEADENGNEKRVMHIEVDPHNELDDA